MTELFSAIAPAYWAKGVPVIPLRVGDKMPVVNDWSRFGRMMPSEDTQEHWLRMYKPNNIGVALGIQSGLVFVDIDALDPKVEAAIMSVLPKSPWRRVGQKGCILAYKFSGERAIKIKDKHGAMLVEILSTGNQAVLPPSIHPKTQMPYESNCELLDVIDALPKLPGDIEDRLRAVLSTVCELGSAQKGKFQITESISLGSRDTQMTRFAGIMAYAVLKGERTVKDALSHMQGWCENMVAKVDGDPIDTQKGLQKVVEFLMNDVTLRGKMLPLGWDLELTPEDKIKWGLDVSEDNEEWNIKQLNDYMFTQLDGIESPTDPKRHEVVKFVINKVARSHSLGELEVGQILNNLRKNSGLDLPMSYYNKELKSLRSGPLEGVNHTEIAEAVRNRFVERHGLLAYHEEQFWCWEGSHWDVVNLNTIWKIIATEFGELAAARRASDHKGIIDVLKNVVPQSISSVKIEGVNFANGFLTTDLTLMPHAPEQGMTYTLPFLYRPELAGKCPKFMSYLEDSWGHHPDYAEKLMALQEAMAVTLFGMGPSYQRAFLLYGVGGTGKSVLLEIISRLTPENQQCAIPPDMWGDKFTCSRFAGKLLNLAGELHETHRIDGNMFKVIVSGDKIQVERKNQAPFDLISNVTHWFASNYLPKTRDVSAGFNRRWLILYFDKVVAKGSIVRDYGKLIAEEEVEAIIPWVVEALPRLVKNQDYTFPASHLEYSASMAVQNSNVRLWLSERTKFVTEGKGTPERTLFTNFWQFCASSMGGKVSSASFKSELNQILMESDQLRVSLDNNGLIYTNLVLKESK